MNHKHKHQKYKQQSSMINQLHRRKRCPPPNPEHSAFSTGSLSCHDPFFWTLVRALHFLSIQTGQRVCILHLRGNVNQAWELIWILFMKNSTQKSATSGFWFLIILATNASAELCNIWQSDRQTDRQRCFGGKRYLPSLKQIHVVKFVEFHWKFYHCLYLTHFYVDAEVEEL